MQLGAADVEMGGKREARKARSRLGGRMGSVAGMQVSVGAEPLAAAGAVAGQSAASPRLVRAAHEFEAQMMSELVKPMLRDTSITGSDDGDSDSGAGSDGALGEFASESLGQALSNAGGFGIANRIIQHLSPASAQKGQRR